MKIGVPRALAYYAYYPFIKTFWENLALRQWSQVKLRKKLWTWALKILLQMPVFP